MILFRLRKLGVAKDIARWLSGVLLRPSSRLEKEYNGPEIALLVHGQEQAEGLGDSGVVQEIKGNLHNRLMLSEMPWSSVDQEIATKCVLRSLRRWSFAGSRLNKDEVKDALSRGLLSAADVLTLFKTKRIKDVIVTVHLEEGQLYVTLLPEGY